AVAGRAAADGLGRGLRGAAEAGAPAAPGPPGAAAAGLPLDGTPERVGQRRGLRRPGRPGGLVRALGAACRAQLPVHPGAALPGAVGAAVRGAGGALGLTSV